MSRIRMDTPKAVEVFRDLVRMAAYFAPASYVTKHKRAVFRKALEHFEAVARELKRRNG